MIQSVQYVLPKKLRERNILVLVSNVRKNETIRD
jgi:hypothetical protein